MSNVRQFASLNDLSRAAAVGVVQVVADAIEQRGRCAIVLSGGRTPVTLYRLLATTYRDNVDWACVHLFWGDERWVSATDPRSNYRMARESLLDHVPCLPDHIHPMPVDAESPDAAARQYERTLRTFLGDAGPGPDLFLLGMGADGHTASLFPESPALEERTRWVVPAFAPVEPRQRITLTMAAINRALDIFLLVAGSDKQSAFAQAVSGHADPRRWPVAMVQPTAGNLTWFVTPMP
jgi:6-phosphogluconolactonase